MRLLLSTNKGLFDLRSKGTADWQIHAHHFKGVASPNVLRDAKTGNLFVALKHGHFGAKFHRSTDDGATWTELAAPAYPPCPEPETNPFSGKVIPWSTQLLWTLESGGRPGELWAGTIPGGLFRSTDSGDNWTLIESLWRDPRRPKWFGGGYDHPGIHSICVNPANPDHLVLGISCGGVWETKDSGETWTQLGTGMIAEYMPPDQQLELNAQDPHRLVACPAAFNHMWVQHHCGIFYSSDTAKTFAKVGPKSGPTDESPSGFGFAVAVDPTNPKTAYFVPAHSDEVRIPHNGKVEVLKTTDGGVTFSRMTKGLPQSNAYDLTFRHALDISLDGRTLVFGTTTGNLFLSPDAGETWHNISHHLPPIFAVRFV